MDSGEFTLHSPDSQRSTGMPGNPVFMSGSDGSVNGAFQDDEKPPAHVPDHESTRLSLSHYELEPCPAGPHSPLHAFRAAAAEQQERDVKLSDVQDALRTELSYNYAQYVGLIGGLSKTATWAKLARFLDESQSDRDLARVAPQALANALNLTVRLLHVTGAGGDVALTAGVAEAKERTWTLQSNHEIVGRGRADRRNRTIVLAHTDDEHYFNVRVKKSSKPTIPNGDISTGVGHTSDGVGENLVAADTADEVKSLPEGHTPLPGVQFEADEDYRDAPEPEKPKWDVFRMNDDDQYHASADEFWTTFRKVFRVLTLVFTFLLMLASAVGSKISLLVMTTNMASMSQNGRGLRCNCSCDESCVFYTVDDITQSSNWTAPIDGKGSDGVESDGDEDATKTDQNRLFTLSERATLLWAWALAFSIITPYIFTFLKSLWNIIGCTKPRWYGCWFLFGILVVEMLHTAGVVLLTTHVLPNLDLLRGTAMMLGVGVVPAALKVFSHNPKHEQMAWPRVALDAFSFIVQLSLPVAFIVVKELHLGSYDWPSDSESLWNHAAFYVSVLLISIRWWPNYVNRFTACCAPVREFANGLNTNQFNQREDTGERRVSYKKKVARTNHLLHLIVSVWKSVLTVLGVVGSVLLKTAHKRSGSLVYQDFFFSTSTLMSYCTRECDDAGSTSLDYSPFVVYAMQVGCCIICYFVGLHACKIQLQKSGFALPLMLATPATVLVLFVLAYTIDVESFAKGSGILLNFDIVQLFDDANHLEEAIILGAIVLWWMSQTRVASHVWFPRVGRISASERLFLQPMFDAEIIEQAMLYNRKNDLDMERTSAEIRSEWERRASRFSTRISLVNGEIEQMNSESTRDPNVDFIYLCATMWHESEEEMKQILKSIYRLDRDQNWRKNAQEFFDVSDPDYYEFEAHIFFDDAFTEHYENGTTYSANSYVKTLIEVVPMAARAVHKRNTKVSDPIRIPTPYGGRLEWTLPGGNKLIAHLKDKMKIRHKKRWSQVMYMYYFLGHRIIASDFTKNQKEIMAQKTYLLALDGDVDFQPQAVQLLVDMMKRNEDVGAACGRIHPIGSGLIVWYQKFEYAVSHWLQKATEHILGCVLCSPGCFSLFRGSALMDDNVMRRYATPSTEASHYLQFDQGEDRWLCTLLLQQGYRVEYNAAADALTYAPEGFNEFYNQRRRWGPSTMANILDLLMDVKHVIKVNRYMSFMYIAYQALMFFASLLGPGTIFLMITGALSLVLKGGDDLPFILNAVPIVFYVIISYFTSDTFQLKVASLLSAIYALVMGLVMVSVAIEINKNICSSSAIFFFVVAGTFMLAALLHPQEMKDVIFGIVYYLLIPCMYLFLIIYSMVNLNNVSWGTREVKPSNVPAPEVKVQQRTPQTIQGMLSSFIKRSDNKDEDDGATYSCGSACKVVCCPRPNKAEESKWLLLTSQLEKMTARMKSMAADMKLVRKNIRSGRYVDTESDVESDIGLDEKPSASDVEKKPLINEQQLASASATKPVETPADSILPLVGPEPEKASPPREELRDDLRNPHWIEEPEMRNGPIVLLDDDEVQFWHQLIATYLKPLDNNPQQQKKIKEQLLELRNKVTFGFFLANVMFVVVIFTLQRQKNEISVEWPCVSSGQTQREKVDPIGLCFLFFFVLVMILQVIGMLFHRLGTFFHIIATTTLTLFKRLSADGKMAEASDDNARAILAMAHNMAMTSKKMSDGAMSDIEFGTLDRKQTKLVHRILESDSEPAIESLDDEFKRKVEKIELDMESERMDENHRYLHNLAPGQKRATINYLRDQRTITSMRRRLSQGSVRPPGGRGSSTGSFATRLSQTASPSPTTHPRRAGVAFKDEQRDGASAARCNTLPSTRRRSEEERGGQAHAVNAAAGSAAQHSDDGGGVSDQSAAQATRSGDIHMRRFSETLAAMRNMSVVLEDSDEDDDVITNM